MITTRLLAPAVGAASILAGVLAALTASVAAADPAPPIPFIPAVPAPLPAVPGSYTYSYYNFPAVAPAAVDARGIKISTNADPAATAAGLPGSKLGNAAHPPNIQTSSSTRYGIAGACGRPRRRAPPVCSSRQAMKTPRWKIPTGAPHRASPVPRPSHPLSCPAHRRHPSWKTRTGSPCPRRDSLAAPTHHDLITYPVGVYDCCGRLML
ncbi:hypothetical protein I542_4412 [Mycobacteroides abscessus 1948]|uniref:Uncharacterized protein n=1 Tax=Mycobacteroides abscessus 1948 TaxID=1299323 RepID=A0A829QLX5_9MYCO|nr:hypothetical protein I542_4412 [Mycobacteroides abscessus 1948]